MTCDTWERPRAAGAVTCLFVISLAFPGVPIVESCAGLSPKLEVAGLVASGGDPRLRPVEFVSHTIVGRRSYSSYFLKIR